MIVGKLVLLERLCASVATSAATAGCTTSESASVAVLPAALFPSPFGVSPCVINGSPRVVAAKATPRAGVQAAADASHIRLRFSTQANAPYVALALDPQSLEELGVAESMPLAPASEDDLARAGRVAEPSDRGARQGPIIVPVDSQRSIFAWTDGSAYAGMDVQVMTVGHDGVPLSAPVRIPHEGSAMGQPAVAVASSGRGIVAFLDSSDRGFRVVAVSLDCTAPAGASGSPSWASRVAP
jgi:hypothetical protein